MKLILTDHAITRFIERYRPDLNFRSARICIHEALTTGVTQKLDTKSPTGDDVWQMTVDPWASFVLRKERDQLVCLTTLPKITTYHDSSIPEYEFELAYERAVEKIDSEKAPEVLLTPKPPPPPKTRKEKKAERAAKAREAREAAYERELHERYAADAKAREEANA